MRGTVRTLAGELEAIKAVQAGNFVLKSGRRSNFYVDIKKAVTRPSLLQHIVEEMRVYVPGHDRIAGMELGAVPLAVALSLDSNVPYVILRKQTKTHGTGKKFEGEIRHGERILLVEDVATTGGTLQQATESLRREGATVDQAVCVVDREEGATEALKEAGVTLISLLRAQDLSDGSEI